MALGGGGGGGSTRDDTCVFNLPTAIRHCPTVARSMREREKTVMKRDEHAMDHLKGSEA